jgi:integrase
MEQTVEYLRLIGKARTSETYATTLRSFKRFRNGEDVEIALVDSDLIQMYEAYLRRREVCPNTVSFYMRILQAVYNRAVEKGLTAQRFPFKHVSIRTEKTVKRAIGIKEIKCLRELELSRFPAMAFARNMFLFSFYTRGMSFVDMAYLKKTDLSGGMLSYRRKKTRQQLYVKWEECMQDIVDKYASQTVNSPYLLPVIRKPGEEERKQYKAAIFTVNTNLKKVGKLAGIAANLTTYVARHSWASIAKSKHIPISVISEGMGHESENTTQIYLSSLDNQTIDNANKLVLSDL